MTLPQAALALILALLVLPACGGREGDDAAATDLGEESTAESEGTTSGDAADLRALGDYELTMEKVNRYFAANRNITRATANMTPEEREALSADANTASLDDIVARIEGNATMRRAIESAGLSVREFATITLAMFQAGMAQAALAMQPGTDADSLARATEMNPANIRFMQEHQAELMQRQQEMQAAMEQQGATE